MTRMEDPPSTSTFMNMEDADTGAFVEWFQSNEGCIDTQVMGIAEFPDSGRGAIALCDIPKGHTLFTLPRALTLSTRTSPLPSLFGLEAWRAHGLHNGWVGLILCLMWEDAWAHESAVLDDPRRDHCDIHTKWGPYIRTLPASFDTPMFWSALELEELQGTAVLEKIGRDDAERAHLEHLLPAIKTSPTLFPPAHHEKWYGLEAYHRAGSRILSRSFTVSRWADDEVDEDECHDGEADRTENDADEADINGKDSIESSVHVDDVYSHSSLLEDINETLGSDSGSDDEDDPSDVAMVPMADVLNARWGSENAKLFYEPIALRMVTTKPIKRGEQILNTYGDPPNSDLLRRYGHVDLVQLGSCASITTLDRHGDVEMADSDMDVESMKHLGNPSDVVEIRADLVVNAIQTIGGAPYSRARIDWWLDENEDDTFVLTLSKPSSCLSTILPPALISLIRLLTLSEDDFMSARSKGKLPKGKMKKTDVHDNKRVMEILDEVLKQREGMYVGGSVEDDEELLLLKESFTKRKQHAVIVRLGEKRVLREVRQRVKMMLAELSPSSGAECRNKDNAAIKNQKGGSSGKEAGSSKKRVVHTTEGDRGGKKARK